MPAEDMSEAVQEAANRLRASRGELTDLILMDMQFSRFFRANADVEAYRDQLRIAAAAGLELEVAPDPGAARRSWISAPAVVVGPDVAVRCARRRMPRRDNVVLLGAVVSLAIGSW